MTVVSAHPLCQIAAMLSLTEESPESARLAKGRAIDVLERFAVSTAEDTTHRWWAMADAMVARCWGGNNVQGLREEPLQYFLADLWLV